MNNAILIDSRTNSSLVLTVSDFDFELYRLTLFYRGIEQAQLTLTESRTLIYFMRHEGVFKKTLDFVKDQPDLYVNMQYKIAVRTRISRLRGKLRDASGRNWFHAIGDVGFVFTDDLLIAQKLRVKHGFIL
jgi:DNA-binding response OmpR family regulator